MGELEDEGLVALAQRGDRGAFEVLVDRYKERAYRIAFDFVRDREDARDLSQEAFLRAFARIRGFDQRSSFYTWFYRILVNLCLDHHRRRGGMPVEPLEGIGGAERSEKADTSATPERKAMAGELSRRVHVALGALPPKQRTAFLLKNHQGLPISEIARIMETAEGTVKSHLHRAVVALRQSLAELSHEDSL